MIADKVRDWLQFGRMHTVILEAPMAVLGAVIGIGSLWDYRVLLWLIFGILYHWCGYSMNSYVDYKKGFDKDDPRKSHHPLPDVRININKAKKVAMFSTVILLVYGLVLVGFSTHGIALIGLMFVSGVSYNYLGKYTRLKFIPISIAHTLVFFIPYYLYTDNIELWVILMTTAYFIHHIYQIAISGDLKDIDQDEASLIQDLGVKLKYYRSEDTSYFIAPGKSLALFYTVAIAQLIVTVAALAIPNPPLPELIITAILLALMLMTVDEMLKQGVYIREERLKWISLKEFLGYLGIHSVAMHVISIEVFVIMGIIMLLYLSSVSKFIWGTYLVPKV
jgi:1,4-dihydroxy-2-naphthoate octaprenyltransferase